jgi:hypothetical protein
LSYGSPDVLQSHISQSNFSHRDSQPDIGNELPNPLSLAKLRDHSVSDQQGAHLLPPGLRYLLVNSSKNSPPGLSKESPRDLVNNTRKIFYTEKAIIAKKEETQKLKEYVVMENERLQEAKRIFTDDR